MENEFGTKNEDEIVKKILEKGDVQSSEVRPHFLTRPLTSFNIEHQADGYLHRAPSARVVPMTARVPWQDTKQRLDPFTTRRRTLHRRYTRPERRLACGI